MVDMWLAPPHVPHASHLFLSSHSLQPSRNPKCPKNHIKTFQDRWGHHASLEATHQKNESIKGPQSIPLSPSLLRPIVMLERAAHAINSRCPTLFFKGDGESYTYPSYFSTIASNAISFEGASLNANDLRHMFATLWRDFINSPTTKLHDLSIEQLNASAADMMLNSTKAWSTSYDDSIRDRAIPTTIALWPKFVEFVRMDHLDKMSIKEWDPLTIGITSLPPMVGHSSS